MEEEVAEAERQRREAEAADRRRQAEEDAATARRRQEAEQAEQDRRREEQRQRAEEERIRKENAQRRWRGLASGGGDVGRKFARQVKERIKQRRAEARGGTIDTARVIYYSIGGGVRVEVSRRRGASQSCPLGRAGDHSEAAKPTALATTCCNHLCCVVWNGGWA